MSWGGAFSRKEISRWRQRHWEALYGQKKAPEFCESKCNLKQEKEMQKYKKNKTKTHRKMWNTVSMKQEMESQREKNKVWHSHHLQQGQVSGAHIVKVDLDVLPPDLGKV